MRPPALLLLQVVQFKMQGVPGHSVVSGKVEFNCLDKKNIEFRNIQLAADDDDEDNRAS